MNGIVVKLYSPLNFEEKEIPDLIKNGQLSISFEGKKIIDIFDNCKSEIGKIILFTNKGIVISEHINGDNIEENLIRLNNDEFEEYQNWSTNEFTTLNEEKDKEKILNALNPSLLNELVK